MPARNIPFHQVIREICGRTVLPVDMSSPRDAALIRSLSAAAGWAMENMKRRPIVRNRPNEVGGAIEPFVMEAINQTDSLSAQIPKNPDGKAQSAGYPDILVLSGTERMATYVECKTFNQKSMDTSFRSFYLSHSDSFKVTHDARHLVLSYEMAEIKTRTYTPKTFKLLDIIDLPCSLKREWNSDNRHLYRQKLLAG